MPHELVFCNFSLISTQKAKEKKRKENIHNFKFLWGLFVSCCCWLGAMLLLSQVMIWNTLTNKWCGCGGATHDKMNTPKVTIKAVLAWGQKAHAADK